MRKGFLLFGLATVASLGPWREEVWADLRFAQPVVDLGRVRSGIPLTHRFAFTCAQGPVDITEVKTTCGCLAPRLEKRVYQRGEEGTLLVGLNTLSQPAGAHVWRAHVLYRYDGSDYTMELQLKADVVREVTVEPAALMLVGDQPVRREIVLKDVRQRPLTIRSVQGSSPALAARVEPPTRDTEGRWQCKIVLDVTPEGGAGRRDEVLSILTDDPDYREFRIPVTVVTKAAQELTATPAELTLTAPAGQPLASQRVLIRHRDQKPVTIERVEAGDPALQVQWAEGEQRVGVVKVNVDRSRLQGTTLKTVIRVQVSQPGREVLVIPVVVSVTGE